MPKAVRIMSLALGAAIMLAAQPVTAAEPAPCATACQVGRSIAERDARIRRLSETIAPAAPRVTWLTDGDAFAYPRETADDVSLQRVDIGERRRTEVVRASEIAAKLPRPVSAAGLTARALSLSPDGKAAILAVSGTRYRYDLAARTVTPLPAGDAAVSPTGAYQVFTRDHDLYATGPDGQTRRLSQDSALWYSFAGAVADTQPTNDAVLDGRLDADPPWINWIGDSSRFYVVRQDLRQTGETWLVDSMAKPRPRLVTQKMPYPGDKPLPKVELWIFDAGGGPGVRVATDGWDHLGNLDTGAGGFWPSKDGATLFFTRMTRGYGVVELCAADVKTGAVRVILSETFPNGSSVRYRDFRELKTGFLWRTERDGYEHYALYDRSGTFVRTVTPEPLASQRLLHVDEARGEILYGAYDDARLRSSVQVRMRRASWLTGRSVALDQEDSHHEVSMAPDGRWYVDTISRPDQAPRIVVRDRSGKIAMTVETSDTSALTASGWTAPRAIRAIADDGKTPLYGWLWPSGDKSGAKHPIVSIVYPGPSGESMPFRFDPTEQASALSELGPAVLRAGERGGSPMRGAAYHRYARTFGNVRDYPIADNKTMILAAAKADPGVDLSRVGVMGHSGGGLMSTTAILLEPDFYKVAVSSAGNHDNNIYEMGSGEFHFGDPVTGPAGSPEGYAANQALASRLKGRLMIVHGMRDSDVPVMNSFRLVDALIKARKDFELLILPSQNHGFTGIDADYARLKMWTFMIDGLNAESPPAVDLPLGGQ